MDPLVAGALGFLGAVTGVLSGVFGVGGGTLVVPALALAGWPMAQAVGTSLVYVVAVGAGGAMHHLAAGNVDRRFVAVFAVVAMVATQLGVLAVTVLPDRILAGTFALFLALMGWQIRGSAAAATDAAETPPPSVPVTVALGLGIGALSGLLGVGGGIVFVPIQVNWLGIPIKRAVGNSLTSVVVTGLAGVAGHAAHGNVAWVPAACLVMGGAAGIFVGNKAFERTSAPHLRLAMAVMLWLVAALMFYRAASGVA